MTIFDDDEWMIKGTVAWRVSAGENRVSDGTVWRSISCYWNSETGRHECHNDEFGVLEYLFDGGNLSQKTCSLESPVTFVNESRFKLLLSRYEGSKTRISGKELKAFIDELQESLRKV